MQRHRVALALAVGLVTGFSLAVSGGVLASRESARSALPAAESRLLAEVLQRVERDYVRSVDEHELVRLAVRGMVSGLDPHSALLDEHDYGEVQIATEGSYVGIGVEVTADDDALVVIAPIDGSPAARAGLRSGDVLVAVDGHELAGGDMARAVDLLRGPPGSHVRLTIDREEVEEPLSIDVDRARVDLRTVRGSLLRDGVGYLRISSFTEQTAVQLDEALARLESLNGASLRGLVLDLRNNPGGVLDAATQVADRFLEHGTIVSATGRAEDARFTMTATPGDRLLGAPMAVLVNGGSASAAEIVAGALGDHDRATLVGRQTFGKGSVQTVLPLSGGQALKLTTSLYFTPSGASIHGRGITPDVVLQRADPTTRPEGLIVEPGDDAEVAAAVRALGLEARRIAVRAPVARLQ